MHVSEAAIVLLSVSGLQLVAVCLLGWPEPATITLQYGVPGLHIQSCLSRVVATNLMMMSFTDTATPLSASHTQCQCNMTQRKVKGITHIA